MTLLAGARARLRSKHLKLVLALATVAALATISTAVFAFPHGTTDLDEVAYQTQANVLREGHLDLSANVHVPFFRPFLSGIRGDRVVMKYQPEWPALIAVSDALFGSSLPLRALGAALGILAVAWLAWELTREERVALIAAALALASPFTWVQSASLLSYELTFVLGTAAAAALLRAARLRTTGAGIGAGALVGLALLHRPFDALLAVVPVLAFIAWNTWGDREVLRTASRAVIGVVPFGFLLAAYDTAVMGSPLRLPYGVTGNRDVFLFGWRASFVVPGTGHAGQIDYTVGRAWSTLGHDLALTPRFLAFAPVALVFAGAAIVKRRRDARCWLLASMVIVVFAGYFFWWATANAAHFNIDRALGPFYDYPVVAPLCVLAAWGVAGSSLRRRSVVVLAAISVVWAGAASWTVLSAARRQGDVRTAEVRETQVDSSAATLVMVPPALPKDPYLHFVTDETLHAKHLVAIDVPPRRLELVDRFSDRRTYLVRTYRRFGDPFGPELRDRVLLTRVRDAALMVGVRASVPGRGAGTTFLRIGAGPAVFSSSGRATIAGTWTLTPRSLPTRAVTVVSVGVTLARAGAPAPSAMTAQWYECRFEARVTDAAIEMLTPCEGWHHYLFPNGKTALANEDVSGMLHITVVGTE